MKSKLRNSTVIVCLATAILVAGCQKRASEQAVTRRDPRLTGYYAVQRQIAGTSVENRPIETITLGEGRDVTLIIATIHGNEPAGTTLANRLVAHLQDKRFLLMSHKVVIVPTANPDGAIANTRSNAHSVDLNRNFEAANRVNNSVNGQFALSEPESRIIAQMIRLYRPSKIVTIHQPLSCIDYDGPAESLARRIGEYCQLPVKKLGARAGSLGAYAGETLQIPTITMELDANDHRIGANRLWTSYGDAIMAAIAFPDNVGVTGLGQR